MDGKWPKKQLKDVVDLNMGQSPPSTSYNTEGDGAIFYQGNRDFGFLYPTVSTYTTQPKKMAGVGDVLISVRAPVGELNIVDTPCCIGRGVAALRLKENHDRFLYYALKESLASLKKVAVGTIFDAIKKANLEELDIFFPPYEKRIAITKILSEIDDKIELNRKMNETLEEMAQAIFKSWFVDFDGVAEEDLVESELGLIPDGWTIESLDKIATFLNGAACQKFPAKEDEEWLPVIKIKQMRAGNTSDADKATITIPKKWHIKDGDVLFSWSASLLIDIWTGGDGALNQHLFKVSSDRFPRWFYLLWSKYHLAEFQRIAAAKATTMGHIKRSHLTEAKVLIPPTEVIENQTNVLKPLLDRLVANRLQSNTLTELRDTLLPKLISGELRIPEAEEQVSELIPQESGQLELFPSNEAKQLHLFPNQGNNT